MPDRLNRRVRIASGPTLDVVEQGSRVEAAGTPPVVLLPGIADSWRICEPVLDRLPPRAWAFAVSQRGHGDSDRPPTGYAPADYAADAVALLDALGVERAVLVGHSSSTFTARLVAAEHPERVAGLVLVGAPLTLAGHRGAAEVVRSMDRLEDPVPEDFVRQFTDPTVGTPLPASYAAMALAENLKVSARVWRESFRALLEYDGARGLDRILAPTLLVWGDADRIIGRPDQDALLAALPSAVLRVYRGLGHRPHLEDPDRFAADLVEFAGGLVS